MWDDPHAEDIVEVPTAVQYPQIWQFALTYDGYRHHPDDAATIGNSAIAAWRRDRTLPDDLDTTRTALFFEQRRYHHVGTDPGAEVVEYLTALLDRIRQLSGGRVRNEHPVL